jgi:hypothetical protein
MIPDSPTKVIAVAIVCVGLVLLVLSALLFLGFTGRKASAENRIARRRRVLKAGRIEFNGNAIECVVRNISETGAAIEVVSPIQCPLAFILVIPSDGSTKPCHVVWQRGKRIGVRFSGT